MTPVYLAVQINIEFGIFNNDSKQVHCKQAQYIVLYLYLVDQ